MTKQSGARLIALDWGTSSCRAFLLGNDGVVLSERRGKSGVLEVSTAADLHGLAYEEAFEEAFEVLCGDWLTALPELPVIACGMIGSNRGWVQAPYRTLPADLAGDGIALTEVPTKRGGIVHIIPGLLNETLPDIMRGEETQVLGAIIDKQASHCAGLEYPRVVLLPGTHSKWVRIMGSTVTSFTTSMTGELFSLLTTNSTLAQSSFVRLDEPDWDAFALGLDVAQGRQKNGGILTTAFSARSLVVSGRLGPNQVQDYLSGLLIGSEIADISASWLDGLGGEVLLCGEPDLNQRYRMALESFGMSVNHETTTSAVAGMWRTAVDAGLLADSGSSATPAYV